MRPPVVCQLRPDDPAVFNKCAVCPTIDPAKKGLGPTLFGVIGRHSATVEGFN
jgi:cytochrome c2